MTRKRTPNQLLADAELQGKTFRLQSVDRQANVTRNDPTEPPIEGEPSYVWRFQSVGDWRRRKVYVTIRTLNPGLFVFEEEYGWNELRLYKAHVRDYDHLCTRL